MSTELLVLVLSALGAVGGLAYIIKLAVQVWSVISVGKPVILTRKRVTVLAAAFFLILSFSIYGLIRAINRPNEDLDTLGLRSVWHWGVVVGNENARFVSIKGSFLQPYASDYKLAFVLIKYTGFIDVLDSPMQRKSALYDIRPEPTDLFVSVDENFKTLAGGTNYFVLVVPKSVTVDQFSTLRQAYSLGVRKLWNGAGPP